MNGTLGRFAQRVFSIACGYPDANDSARLGADPIHKMLLDRGCLGPTELSKRDSVGCEARSTPVTG